MYIYVYMRNILLSVMVIDHSIMQTFQLRKTTSFYFGKIKVIFYNDVFSLTNKQ